MAACIQARAALATAAGWDAGRITFFFNGKPIGPQLPEARLLSDVVREMWRLELSEVAAKVLMAHEKPAFD